MRTSAVRVSLSCLAAISIIDAAVRINKCACLSMHGNHVHSNGVFYHRSGIVVRAHRAVYHRNSDHARNLVHWIQLFALMRQSLRPVVHKPWAGAAALYGVSSHFVFCAELITLESWFVWLMTPACSCHTCVIGTVAAIPNMGNGHVSPARLDPKREPAAMDSGSDEAVAGEVFSRVCVCV